MVRIEFNTDEITAALNAVQAQVGNLEPAFRQIGEHYQRKIDDQFREEKDPYGRKWAALAPRTVKYKAKKKRISKILQSRGTMRASVSYRADARRVIIGFAVPYAKYHQGIGFTPTRRKLPIRLLLPDKGLPAEDERAIVGILEDHLRG